MILSDADNELSDQARELFADMHEQLHDLDTRIERKDKQILAIHKQSELRQRQGQVGSIGPLTATAFIASLADANMFRRGRECSAWLGLVPRQFSSGGKTILGSISKRGDRYLRTHLIHGTRSVLSRADKKPMHACAIESASGNE